MYDNVYAKKFSELASLPKNVPIICHGGGNFGDLYPAHQSYRERLASEFQGHKLIVFPQSLHFGSDEAMLASSAIFRKHPNFHLCVRDHDSVDIGRLFTENVHLVPDSAHMLWDKIRPAPAGSGRLKFMRIDIESAGQAGESSRDWETLSSPTFYKTQAFMQRLTKSISRRPTTFSSNIAFALWMREVRRSINEARTQFAPYEVVETDRLHGMLFSLLLRKPVAFRDNSVKKLSRYAQTWLGDLSGSWVRAVNDSSYTPAPARTEEQN